MDLKLWLAMAIAWTASVGYAGSHRIFHKFKIQGQSYDVSLETSDKYNPSEEVRVTFSNGSSGSFANVLVVGYSSPKILDQFTSQALKVEPIAGLEAARVFLPTPDEVLRWTSRLEGAVGVRYVHPDFKFPLEGRNLSPSDEPLFKDQWNLENTSVPPGSDIGVKTAWQVTTGSNEVIVGLLDLGFEQDHEDLIGAWFVNEKEIAGNKKDDDGNGYVDDVRGWNFSIRGTNLIYGQNPKHGTATAGIIGARANGVGITGICPGCKMLPIVVSGRVSEDAEAITYAVRMGVSVLSNSWGYNLDPPTTDVVAEALHMAATRGRDGKGMPIIFAMHNAAVDDCKPGYPDISAHPDVIAVSSVDADDLKVPQSGYGKCLAFVAPSSGSSARGVATTDRMGSQGYNTDGSGNFSDLSYHAGFWGTSAAAPQVSGLFALLLSAEPDLLLAEAIERMKGAAVKVRPNEAQYDPVNGHSVKYGFGRIHAGGLFRQ